MAADPDHRHARTFSQRETEIASSPTWFGRGVGDQFNDSAVSDLVSAAVGCSPALRVALPLRLHRLYRVERG
jgi:hypothetical protein